MSEVLISQIDGIICKILVFEVLFFGKNLLKCQKLIVPTSNLTFYNHTYSTVEDSMAEIKEFFKGLNLHLPSGLTFLFFYFQRIQRS